MGATGCVYGINTREQEQWSDRQTDRPFLLAWEAVYAEGSPRLERIQSLGSLTHCWKEATSGVKRGGHSDSAPAALGNCVWGKGSEEELIQLKP